MINVSVILLLNLVPGHMQQSRKLDLGDAPQLVEVKTFPFAEIPAVMVHWVSDGTGAFKELRGWESILMERLVVRTAGWGEADLELWAVKRGNVPDEVRGFRSPDATKPKRVSHCVLVREMGLTCQGKPVEPAPQGRDRPTYPIGS